MLNKLAVIVAFIGIAIGGYFYVVSLQDNIEQLENQNSELVEQVEVVKTNINLLENLLESEREAREAAEAAVLRLHNEVPDEDFNQPLPESIQDVLDQFHDDIASDRVRP